jgi:hypothetical protein
MTEKIAAVIDSFDEEGRQPANYVVELSDGGFEARCGTSRSIVS